MGGGRDRLSGMDATRTVVRQPAWVTGLVWTAFPPLGAAGGWLLLQAAGWLADLRWVPLRWLFRMIDAVPEPLATLGALGLGGVAGLALAYAAHRETLTVAIGWDAVTTARPGQAPTTHPRGRISAAFLHGKQLVLLGPGGEELAREQSDLAGERLGAAFTAHGYPWRPDGDPFEKEYRRWIPDEPGLPPAANALLRARERALRGGDSTDVAELRGELASIGVVVRETGKRQYWRRVD
jgi:hypothetical protein